MPRTLPWLKDAKSSARPSTTSRASAKPEQTPLPRPTKRQKRDPSSTPSDQSPEPTTSTSRRHGAGRSRAGRTPSTSPAPLPPPSESPMCAGDDAWVMVEDEFYATAGAYTSHLHLAEYKRLQREAWKRSDEAIEEIERPTDGRTRMSEPAKLKHVQEAKRKGIGKALVGKGKLEPRRQYEDEYQSDNYEEDDAGNTLEEMKDKALAGLMMGTGTGRRPVKRRLAGAMKTVNPNTRAAAGFGKQKAVQKPRQTGGVLEGLATATSAHRESLLNGSPRDARKTVTVKTEDRTEPISSKANTTFDSSSRNRTNLARLASRLPSEPQRAAPSTYTFSQRAIKSEDAEINVKKPVLSNTSSTFSFDELPARFHYVRKGSSAAGGNDAKSKGVKLEDIPTFLF